MVYCLLLIDTYYYHYLLPTAYHLLPTTYLPTHLPTTYYLLPTAYYLQLTTYLPTYSLLLTTYSLLLTTCLSTNETTAAAARPLQASCEVRPRRMGP